MKIKGVILDMDGVVVDNHEFHFIAWMDFAQKYKFPLDEKIYRDEFNGKTNADLFRKIFGPGITEDQIKAYAAEKEGLYQKLYLPMMKPLKGLEDFLKELQHRKIKIALGTSAPPMNVDFVLDRLLLRQYFTAIVDGTMVSRGKPDPEVYRICCARLGFEPNRCVVFEDSLAGLESGLRAGCEIIGVATSHKPTDLVGMTDKIIFDFTEALRYIR